MKAACACGLFLTLVSSSVGRAADRGLTPEAYVDRVHGMWVAQIAATLMAWPYEHQVASVLWLTNYPKPYRSAPVDDDWYYEMVAVRGFERFGIQMTVAQLGQQWLENACGSWGSSEQARLALQRGLPAPDCGHPRNNQLWFTIGPQFSADVYGALAPGLPNLAGRIARELGHINGYAEGTDGAVFVAAMVSLAFREDDPKAIVRKAARLIHPDSPYRQCLDLVVSLAEQGRNFGQIVEAVEDRWHIEYPATNNAVANGGIVAACVWFGDGDFLHTVNLAARAADFTDADCNAANAAAVVGAMHGLQAVPRHLIEQLGDRIHGDRLGPVRLTPAVDETISGLARRTAAIGARFLVAEGATLREGEWHIPAQEPLVQKAELFALADLTRFWDAAWNLEGAGFGGAGGGMGGIRGQTHLEGDVLATYPRDEVRGARLSRTWTASATPSLHFEAGVDPDRAWELNVYANNSLVLKAMLDGTNRSHQVWHHFNVDLPSFAGQEIVLRLYQRVLLPGKTAGNAYWKNLEVR